MNHVTRVLAIRHGETGYMMDFFDPAVLTRQVIALCQDPAERARLGAQARAFAVAHYDLETRCLPGQMAWVQGLGDNRGY
jgi:glycosyltransferase involved in cell wall biosynthesis